MAPVALRAVEPAHTVDILCPSADHPVNDHLALWAAHTPATRIIRSQDDLPGGDFLFLISCGELVGPEVRSRYRHVLVIHAADLPRERGWSPHIWAILEGRNEIVVTLLEAREPVDSGPIWHQHRVTLDGTETFAEINAAIFAAELELMTWALINCETVIPREQVGDATWRKRRTPTDSELRPGQSIAEAFDLLRVCDPARFPAFFFHRGERYELVMRKADHQASTVA